MVCQCSKLWSCCFCCCLCWCFCYMHLLRKHWAPPTIITDKRELVVDICIFWLRVFQRPFLTKDVFFGTRSMFDAVSLSVHYLLDSFRPALAEAFYIQLVVDVLANASQPHPKVCRSLLPWGRRSATCLPVSNP